MGNLKTNFAKRSWITRNLEISFIQGVEIDEDKFIAAFCFDNNSTRRTCLEMLNMYEVQGIIIRKDGKIIEPNVKKMQDMPENP